MALTLTNEHMRLLRGLNDGETRDVFTPAIRDTLVEMAEYKLVKWEPNPRQGDEWSLLGQASILPDGASTLADLDEICPNITRLA